MNNSKIEQYHYLVSWFPEDEQDAATDGLLSACNSTNLPAEDEEAVKFVMTSMKNRVKDMRKQQSRQKEPTKMTTTESEKEFTATKPAGNTRTKYNRKGSFEQFYGVWLSDNNLTDCMRNRREAEEAWDNLKAPRTKPQEVSLSEVVFSGSDDERTVEDFIATSDLTAEAILINNQDCEELLRMDGVTNPVLRGLIELSLPKYEGATKSDIISGYLKAFLNLTANRQGWKKEFKSDIPQLCALTGIKESRLVDLTPFTAKRSLSRMEKKDTHVYQRTA